jgi:DNA-binding MarR family transcriptional regulator
LPGSDAYEGAAALREALRAFLRQSDQVTRRHGLTTQRYELLLMIRTSARDGRATVSQLARRLSLAQSSTSELVDRTEDLGLVRRDGDTADRRAVVVSLTAEGERRLSLAVEELKAERRRLVEALALLA